jgi:DNA-formamidopyrimidine glycosylase
MPEGPELRRSADAITRVLAGRLLTNAYPTNKGRYAVDPPVGWVTFMEQMRDLGPCRVLEVNVKGKFMWWSMAFQDPNNRFNNPRWWLWITYGMSAQWTSAETKHTAFSVERALTEDRIARLLLHFNDQRHFGTLKFVNDERQHLKKLASLGPDMLSDPPDIATFRGRLLKLKNQCKTLAEVLMDQSTISGVGNYVKAESLYLAALSPHRQVDSLTNEECDLLREQIINVMRAAYDGGGVTLRTYVNPDGTPGTGQRRLCVYGHSHDPMGNPVIREETNDGRTTHWVREVQK